jgi:glucoamylase
MKDYVDFNERMQKTPMLGGLGAAWVNLDGSPNWERWGVPQNDGPALRAHVLCRFAKFLIQHGQHGQMDYVLSRLYIPGRKDTVISADLEYTSLNAFEKDIDPWEMTRGHHFFNRIVKVDALRAGAELAELMSDPGRMAAHWSEPLRSFVTTVDRDPNTGWDYHFDTAVILGALTRPSDTGPFSISDDRLLSTAAEIRRLSLGYPINSPARQIPGVAILRHFHDSFWGGNPWFLTTAAFGELNHRLSLLMQQQKKVQVTLRSLEFYGQGLNAGDQEELRRAAAESRIITSEDPLFAKIRAALDREGESYAQRIQTHCESDGTLFEQMCSFSGFSTAAKHLTWSYVSFIRQYEAWKAARVQH